MDWATKLFIQRTITTTLCRLAKCSAKEYFSVTRQAFAESHMGNAVCTKLLPTAGNK